MTAQWERQLHRLREAPVPLERVRERAQQPPRPGSPLPPTRERVIAGVVAVAVFVALAAFGWRAFTTPGDHAAPLDAPPALPASPFSLWLTAERVPPGPVELVAFLVNHDGSDATFGVFAKVDRWDGREWVPYGELVMCMDHWHCTARVQRPGEIEGVPDLGLSAEPGRPGPMERFSTQGLDVGWYRISQEANEGIVAAALLEIVEGAPAPAPLVSIDAPAISVTPALVPPDGAQIYLYPLIPAPTGAQSREDVLAAIRGLSKFARIERWNGSTWEAAREIQLSEADDNLARIAELPPLPEGEYRLVREGPEGQHIGHFWVDEPSNVSEGTDPLVIEITSPQTHDGTFVVPRFRVSYRGTTISLDAIETPGSELEYPSTVASVPLAAGAPIEIHAEGAQSVAVFELRHATGEYVRHGSCIVPGAISALPNQAGSFAFFIYADWGDSVGGMAFAADVFDEGPSRYGSSSPASEVDARLLGLAVCEE